MATPEQPLQGFISCADRDQDLKEELKIGLADLERKGLVKFWDYQEIKAGAEWEREIGHRLDSADIVLLLISRHFVGSNYCWTREMPRAMDRHNQGKAVVIPVLLRATPNWKTHPYADLNVLPGKPSGRPDLGEAVESWPDREEAWTRVVEGITTRVNDVIEQRAQEGLSPGRAQDGERSVRSPRDASTGSLWKYPGSYSGQIVAGPDDLEMVWVEPGEFQMGASWERADNNEKPVHPVHITRGFWLGRCVVTDAKFADFLNAINTSVTPDGKVLSSKGRIMLDTACAEIDLVGNTWFGVQVGREKHPAAGVTPYGADAYAAHHGLRLPTDAQWEYAARGESNWRYPWGNQWDKEKCRHKYNQPPDGRNRFPVDSFPEGESWCGALNMVGNVWESCADWFDAEYYKELPEDDPQGPPDTGMRVVRGGSFFYDEDSCTTTSHHGTPPENTTDSLGFRCAYTPEAESGEAK